METTPNEKELRIKELIASNKIEAAIIELKRLLVEHESEFFDEIISVQARYTDLEQKIRTNMIEHNQVNVEKATIVNAILLITKRIFQRSSSVQSLVSESLTHARSASSRKSLATYWKYVALAFLVILSIASFQYYFTSVSANEKTVVDSDEGTDDEKNNQGIMVPVVETSSNSLSGNWSFILYYNECESNQKFPKNLQTRYIVSLKQNGDYVSGTGSKTRETFKGKNTVYSQDIPVELNGTFENDRLNIKFEETNGKGHKVLGILNLKRGEGDFFRGKFELGDFNCEGNVQFKRNG